MGVVNISRLLSQFRWNENLSGERGQFIFKKVFENSGRQKINSCKKLVEYLPGYSIINQLLFTGLLTPYVAGISFFFLNLSPYFWGRFILHFHGAFYLYTEKSQFSTDFYKVLISGIYMKLPRFRTKKIPEKSGFREKKTGFCTFFRPLAYNSQQIFIKFGFTESLDHPG